MLFSDSHCGRTTKCHMRSLTLLHAEVVVADVLRVFARAKSFQRKLVFSRRQRARGHVERNDPSGAATARGQVADSENLLAPTGAEIGEEAGVFVPPLERNLDMSDLHSMVQQQ